MNAAYLTGLRQVEVRRAADPKIERPQDVLLRIEAVGVCGSDMHYYRTGRIGSQVVEFPWIIGHECAATVLETGSGVDTVSISSGGKVGRDAMIKLGGADDTFSHAGSVGRKLLIDGGSGTDTFNDGGTAKDVKTISIEA